VNHGLGLSSAQLGSVRFGLTDVTSAQGFDSSVSQLGDLGNTSGDVGADKAQTVRYTTPTFSGITAEVGYSNASATTKASTDATSALNAASPTGTITSAALKYEAGALGLYVGQTTAKISATYDQKDTFYGAKYDFGFASVGIGQRVVNAASATEDGTKGDLKSTVFSVAAPVPALGSGVKAHFGYIKANSEKADRTATTAATDALGVADNKKTTFALTKALSKRTTAYAAYINTSFDDATNADTKARVIGINHVF
jgi:Gram-negative porin